MKSISWPISSASQNEILNSKHTYIQIFRYMAQWRFGASLLSVKHYSTKIGAKIIEKHITFDKNARGSDHNAALDIEELNLLVKNIRNTEMSLGNYNKEMYLRKLHKEISYRIRQDN